MRNNVDEINISEQIESSEGRKIFAKYLKDTFKSDLLIEKFDKLTKLYFEVNSVINISALRTADDTYVKHYLDSLYPHEYLFGKVCDVGCGGGFPCLPLAIATDLEITGVESIGKKLALIKRSIPELGLDNLKYENARAEDLAKAHKSYDTVCARALADINKALSFCAPLLKPGGRVVLYRSQNDERADDKVLKRYNIKHEKSVDYVLPGTDIKRRIVIFKNI